MARQTLEATLVAMVEMLAGDVHAQDRTHRQRQRQVWHLELELAMAGLAPRQPSVAPTQAQIARGKGLSAGSRGCGGADSDA
eukprot:12888270-Prorocentrum_lima.AAC.1